MDMIQQQEYENLKYQNQQLEADLIACKKTIKANEKEAEIRLERGKVIQARKGRSRQFVKVFFNNIDELLKSTEFDNAELALLFHLVVHLDYGDNWVVGRNNQRLSISDLVDIVGAHRTTISNTLAKLEKKMVLRRIKNGGTTNIMLDSSFFYRGSDPLSWPGYPKQS